MKKLILYLLLIVSMPVFSQVTRTVAESKIDSLLPDNSSRQITPARLRAAAKILLDYAESLDTTSTEIGNRKIKGMLDIQRGGLSLLMGGRWNDTTRAVGQPNGAIIAGTTMLGGKALMLGHGSVSTGSFLKWGGGESEYSAVNGISEYTTPTPGTLIGNMRRYVFGTGRHWFGSSPVDDGINLVTVNGPANIKGDLTTQNIVPDGNNTRDLGAGGARWNNIYGANFLINSSAAVTFGSINSASPIQFRQGNSSQLIAGFFPTSGRMFLQAASTIPTDNGVDQLQVSGSANFTGGIKAQGNWSDYQATFGSTGQGGRIQFINGTGFQAGVIGTLTSSSTIFRVGTPLDLDLLSTGANVVIANNNASGAIYIRASGTTNGNIRFQTGATESGRVFTNGNWLIGSDGVDDGSKLRVQGLLTTQGINSSAGIVCGGNILPSTNNNLSIGNSSNTYLAGFFQSLYTGVASRAFNIAQTGLNAIVFRVHPTTGNIVIQSPGVAPPDDGVNQLQVLGSTISTQYRLSALNTAPASATATGTLGEIRVTAGYIYVCTATNTWVRAGLTTW